MSAIFACAAAAQTITVGLPGSGAMHTTIQAGINAAPPGGIVEVQAGAYGQSGGLVINKPLTLLGAGSAVTSSTHLFAFSPGTPFVVTGLAPGQHVFIVGFEFLMQQPSTAFQYRSVDVVNCQGPVVIVDVKGFGCATVSDSTMVTFERCLLTGVNQTANSAVRVERSFVQVNECELNGLQAGVAGPAVDALDATLRFARSRVVGGHATSGTTNGGAAVLANGTTIFATGGSSNHLRGGRGFGSMFGGPALNLSATSSCTRTPDVVLTSGLNGNGQTTTPVITGAGQSTTLAFELPTMAAGVSQVMSGGSVQMALGGEPSATCIPLVALGESNGVSISGVHGLFVLNAVVPLAASVLDASGVGSASVLVPPSPPLVGSAVYAQSVSLGPSGWIGISVPTAFAVR